MEQIEAVGLICDILAGKPIADARLGKMSPADGESLADWAIYFNVGGLFYREIKSRSFATDLIPVEGRDRLRAAYRSLAIRNTSLFMDASEALKSLAGNQVPVIALKGLSLAKSVYGDIALRPMSDVDLLVKEKDLARAGRTLLTLGYKQYFPAWDSTLRTRHHLPPFKNDRGAMIELHWNIATLDSPIRVDLEGLWERSRPIRVDHAEARALSPEDMFLHACIHACFHLQTGMGLIPLCDIAGLVKTSSLDWPVIMKRAARWGGLKCVYLMSLLAREMLGAALPENIMSEMKPDDYRPVYYEEALEQIYQFSPSGQLIRQRIGSVLKTRRGIGIIRKASVLLKGAFPSREHLARIYPVSVSGPKIYLYYLLRLGGLTLHHAAVLLRLVRRDPSVMRAVRQGRRASAVSDWMFS